jgi:putative DNA primase/helicase
MSNIDDAVHSRNAIADIIDTAEEVAAVEAVIDLKAAGLSQRDALLMLSDEVSTWRSPDGQAFVSVLVDNHTEYHPVQSRPFRNLMRHRLACRFTQGGRPAAVNENVMRDALGYIEARTLLAPKYPAEIRSIEHEGAIYLDRGTEDWSVICVTPREWSIIPQSPVPILRGKRTAPFPTPPTDGDFEPLRRLLDHLEDDTFCLFVAWCLGALLPNGPYPILVLCGEQGSGKSTLARLAQRIADPIHGDLLQPPRNDRDLIAAAKANRVLAIDNVSSISAELADSFCRLATGSEIGGRALYSDHDTASFAACRPLVINSIPDLAARADLADRSIVLRLANLPARMTEKEWRRAVEAALPATFGALLNALSYGLRAIDGTPTPDIRMADFARFIVAAEPALPWKLGSFVESYERSRLEVNTALADGDSVSSAIREFMGAGTLWSGLVSELQAELTAMVSKRQRQPPDWPANPRWFGDRIRRAAPILRTLDIDCRDRRTARGTEVTLARIAPPATSAAPNASDQEKINDGANCANVAKEPMPLWDFSGWDLS